MMKNTTFLMFFFLMAILLISCRREAEIPEDLVAQVNDHYLGLTQVNQSMPEGIPDDLALSLKKNLISKWVENETLYQVALDENITLDEFQQFLVEEYRKSLIIQNYLNQKLNLSYNISAREIEDYYKAHQEEFRRTEDEAHIVHLFTDQYDKAIFKEIRSADNLQQIIKKYYFDEKSNIEQPNGDLGYVPLSELPAALVKEIKRLKTGKISRPVKIGDGYHFVQLIDYQKKGSIRDLTLVEDEIILRLKKRKRDEMYQQLIQEAQKKVQIQTYLSKIQ